MADQASLGHGSPPLEPSVRGNDSNPESNSLLQSRNPFRSKGSSPNNDTPYHGTSSGEAIMYSDGAGERQKSTFKGLGVTGGLEDNTPSPMAGLQMDDATRSYLSPPVPSPGISGAQLSRSDTKRSAKSVAWGTPDDQDSLYSSPYIPYTPSSDRELLSPSRSQHEPHPGLPHFDCQTDNAIIGGRWSWLSITILVLSIYSTVLSGIYLGVALIKPRYGRSIGTNGHMSVATVSILSTTFAKTIELSFVTVFVTFLGQVLSRRAFLAKARGGGISIAEMLMRNWIMQPGTLITHGEVIKYAALSFLGAASLTAAFMAMIYVTAAEALVSPKLHFGPAEDKVLYGKVAAAFGNANFLAKTCPTPIREEDDPEYRGTTCLQIEHAGQAYHNYQLYLDSWTKGILAGNLSGVEYAKRPPPIAVMWDNTTVRGQWITPSHENITADSATRLVQNVTMAMPHANVFNAARDSANGVLQPEELNQGEGEYIIKASVPAPTVNILCAGVTEADIESLIYVKWPSSNGQINASTWPAVSDMLRLPAYPNATAVDDLFDFGPKAGENRQRAPIFPRLPQPYNTLVNGTGAYPAHSVYLIAGSPPHLTTSPYVFCSLRATQYLGCTTQYRAAKTGGALTVHCDGDAENTMPYKKSYPDAPSGGIWDANWKDVASEWANSLSLGTGISDANASNARLLTQLIPKYDDKTHQASLDPMLPSIGEALGAMSGCNLLLSSLWSPFIHYWNYTTSSSPMLDQPEYQSFNASLAYRDYASGASQPWQGIFYIVLLTVFATNFLCLIYLIWTMRSEGQVTDYTEPQNLFALAVNSPPSSSLSGACGAGPEGGMLGKKWEVDMQTPRGGGVGHPHFYMKCSDDDHMDAFHNIRQRKSRLSLRSMDDFEVAESPAVEQYKLLANRKSLVF